jgi:hypothetical protein
MKIELISEADYNLILKICTEHPVLTFQNIGYEYIDKSKFSESDQEAFDKVTEILKKHIVGFVEFNNFLYSIDNKLRLRVTYYLTNYLKASFLNLTTKIN